MLVRILPLVRMNGEKDALQRELRSLKYGVVFSASLIALAISSHGWSDAVPMVQVASLAIGLCALVAGACSSFVRW